MTLINIKYNMTLINIKYNMTLINFQNWKFLNHPVAMSDKLTWSIAFVLMNVEHTLESCFHFWLLNYTAMGGAP